jgi:hypothetical protein
MFLPWLSISTVDILSARQQREEEGEQTGKEKGGKREGRQKTRKNRVAGEDKDD